MQAYWLTFTDGTKGCCEGQSEYDAKMIAETITGKTVKGGKFKDIDVVKLPYPARPLIWQFDHPICGKTPDFCYDPENCKGNESCRKSRACTE